MTVAHGLNIVPADGTAHLVIDALDIEEYDIANDFDAGCNFIAQWLPKGPVLGCRFVFAISACSALRSRSVALGLDGHMLPDAHQPVVLPEELRLRQEPAQGHMPQPGICCVLEARGEADRNREKPGNQRTGPAGTHLPHVAGSTWEINGVHHTRRQQGRRKRTVTKTVGLDHATITPERTGAKTWPIGQARQVQQKVRLGQRGNPK